MPRLPGTLQRVHQGARAVCSSACSRSAHLGLASSALQPVAVQQQQAGAAIGRSSSSSTRARAGAMAARARPDHSSFADTDVRVRHSHYELDVNFDSRVINGYVHLHAEAAVDAPSQLTLDTRDLAVTRVELLPSGEQLQFSWGDKHAALGTPLRIQLPAGLAAGSQLVLGVRFATSPSSSCVQFLEPGQTAGGQQPYLFTQAQAIHARSLLPCQDTPAIKATYSAAVRVPGGLTALMSAVPCDAPPALPGGSAAPQGVPHLADVAPQSGSQGRLFYFHQSVPIPSYLIALAVGQLESRELSDRSRVWSEPCMVDAAAYEFADTAQFLEAGEALAGPYVWGRYDLLLLPPSFPYGGMENPCLTFVTPTLLAGDRSLTNVVAHEIAHSWTGNLVTNASWEHFWLNEGWTVFLERKILGRLKGEAALQFAAAQGASSLEEEVGRIGARHNFTRLVPDLSAGEDPDDAFSRVPYEKGFYFLYYLQDLVGGPPAFEQFMKHYLTAFAFKTVSSEQFKACFLHFFKDTPAVAGIDWDAWLHAPGLPPAKNGYDTCLAAAAHDLAVAWHTADVMGLGGPPPAGAGPGDIAGWGSEQVVAFLEKLSELRSLTPLAPSMCRALDAAYGFSEAKNCEIRAAWLKLAIAAEDTAALPCVVDLLSSQGRMKYLRPLYRALYKSKAGRQVALDTFASCKDKYHPIAKKMVAVDLQVAA